MNEEEKNVIEDMGGEPEQGFNAKAFTDAIRAYVQKGNITRIMIRRGADVIVNLPLNAGIVGGLIGAVAAPWALIAAAVATAGFDCTVELVKDTGEIVDMSPRVGLHGLGDALRDAGESIKKEFTGAEDAPSVDEEIPFDDVNKEE